MVAESGGGEDEENNTEDDKDGTFKEILANAGLVEQIGGKTDEGDGKATDDYSLEHILKCGDGSREGEGCWRWQFVSFALQSLAGAFFDGRVNSEGYKHEYFIY